MRITIDPQTDAGGFGYVDAGQYRLRIKEVEKLTGPKADYLKWQFEHVDPNVKAVKETQKPGNIFENTTLQQGNNSQFRLKQLIDALGLDWNDFDTEETIGLEFDCVLGIKEYNGMFSNEVKKYIPVNK